MSIATLVSVTAAGFAAGGLHVFMGPDHLAAVAPLAMSQRARAWLLGFRWGLGHASGVGLVALAAWAFREILPVEHFSSQCERLVGVMLIGIGLWGVRKAMRLELHTHEHEHDGSHHIHLHSHEAVDSHAGHTHTALAVGILHGLAGASHFLGVLPALAMPTRAAAALYLLFFGLGTIAAMVSFAGLLGYAGARVRVSGALHFKRLMLSSAGVAILVGGYWLSQ